MDEKALGSMAEPTHTSVSQIAPVPATGASTQRASNDQRQAYGTAKTENLKDSGLWRILLPAVVVICCVSLFVIPLIILIPLLFNSITTTNAKEAQLIWVWITMIVIEMSLFVLIARGILKIFLTQAGNYQK